MAVLLFRLRGVPDDEAEEVRLLLDQHGIDYYETSAGNWGVSMPAIWLHDKMQLQYAKNLIQTYQTERIVRIKSEQQTGQHRTILHSLTEQPLRFIVYIMLCVVIVYFSIMPFFEL